MWFQNCPGGAPYDNARVVYAGARGGRWALLMKHSRVRWTVLSVAVLMTLIGCEGPVGPEGKPGPAGETPDLGMLPDEGPPPPDAGPPDLGPPPDGGLPPGTIPLEPAGLVGRVIDTAGDVLAGGRVVLVPASEVAALSATVLDQTLTPALAAAATNDEPLEDIIDAAGATLASATIDEEGVYRFVTLPDASVFVVVMPAAGDLGHLPGGEQSRFAQAPASLLGQRIDYTVSTAPGADATYVGSGACTNCHGRHRAFGTAHFVGLNVPGRRGYLEDTSRWPDFDAALARFEAGVTLHFYDCNAAAEVPCSVSETAPAPASRISFDAELSRNALVPVGERGAYVVTLRNVRGAGVATYPIDLTYGGVLARQDFIVSVARPGGMEHHVLPFQFQHNGVATASDTRGLPWADVGSAGWYDFTAGALRVPGSLASFDRACAGCHFTGFRLAGDSTNGFRASALPTLNGAADYDSDGRLEDINVGCEGCHGPGSNHVDARGRGIAIISPQLLTAEREDVICGTCHTRAAAGPALDAAGQRPRPGIRRAELLADFTTSPMLTASDTYPSGDPRHAQLEYPMHASSAMARNGRLLTACTNCHDVHGVPTVPHDLRAPTDTPNVLCTGCHGGDEFRTVRTHVVSLTPATPTAHNAVEDAELVCTTCHMPPTAFGGAAQAGLFDSSPVPTQYWMGDLATHRYKPSRRAAAATQPATVTQTCAFCHGRFLPAP